MINSIFPRLYQTGRWPAFVRGVFTVCAVLLLAGIVFSQTAYAAGGRQGVTHKISINHADIDPQRTLDWRSPIGALTFDIPDNDWVDSVELLLSARPQGRVHANTPLLVRFNDASPIPLDTGGHGFDARITLDRMHIRGRTNKVSIEYQVPEGDSCLGPGHGAWGLDVKDSFIVVKSKTKLQALNFHDVRALLGSDAAKPKSIAILSKGKNKTNLEALAAQGISRNLSEIPQFRLGTTSADMIIVAARRNQLGRWVNDANIRKGSGPQIAIAKSRPAKIVLTGDTDEEVLAAAKAFSSAAIPDSRLQNLSPDAFTSGNAHLSTPKRVSGKVLLSALGAAPFTQGWAPRPQLIEFDVVDPAASHGKLNLHLQTGTFVDPSSRLDVSLNGQILKTIPLVKSKSRVRIDIPHGQLKGLGNRLVLTPHLTPSQAQPACAATRMGPGLGLGVKSSLTVSHDSLSDAADLSAFAASGAPFASTTREPSTVILATQSKIERAAALRVVAQLSRASHRGWADAHIIDADDAAWPTQGHVLVIGSQTHAAKPALLAAPRSLKSALSGARYQNPVATKLAVNSAALPVLLPARESLTGGVAALYRDGESRIVGVITQTRGQSFTKAMDDLLKPDHWNALEGSVARWNHAKVAMAQTALPPKNPTRNKASLFKDVSAPKFGTMRTSIGGKWESLVKRAEKFWEKPEASPLLPDSVQGAESQKISIRKMSVPTPRIKPSSITPAMIGQRPIAVPKAPREDIFPKIDVWVSEMGTKMGAGFSGLSAQVSGAVKATPIGEDPANESASPKLLVFAIGIIFLLILAVFISPGKTRSDES